MPTLYDLKPAFQRLLRPIAAGLVRRGWTPNQVTVAALVLSAAVGALMVWRRGDDLVLLLLPAALLGRMALNAIDGMMAREHGLASPLGALLNELGDVAADAVLYLPLALWPGIPAAWVVVAVVLAVISEMTGVVAVQIGATRRYEGPMGKSDRALVFGVLALALGLGIPPAWWLSVVLGAMSMLLVLTVVHRARAALREIAGR